jgi:hypothetical protein
VCMGVCGEALFQGSHLTYVCMCMHVCVRVCV